MLPLTEETNGYRFLQTIGFAYRVNKPCPCLPEPTQKIKVKRLLRGDVLRFVELRNIGGGSFAIFAFNDGVQVIVPEAACTEDLFTKIAHNVPKQVRR